MNRSDKELLARIAGQRLAVVGDSMLDRFLWGQVERISPEAPVPVVRLERETVTLGGAANVATNLRALGARVTLFSVCGVDEAASQLRALLAESGIDALGVLTVEDRPTTVKTRIVAHSQQVVRADRESDAPIAPAIAERIAGSLAGEGPFQGVILSDYAKGVLTSELLAAALAVASRSGAPIVVDPKRGDYARYRGVTALTPNQREAEQACAGAVPIDGDLDDVGRDLLRRTAAEAVLITRGEHGMALYEREGGTHHLPTVATEVFDVTGAGDTVAAVFTAALAAGGSFVAAAELANHAAGLAVRELGTTAISAAAIARELDRAGGGR